MPKQFDDMVTAVKVSLKKQHPHMKEDDLNSRAFAIATDNWKKSHGGKSPSKEKVKDWKLLEFYVPIEEKINSNDDFIIKGIAINETTTLNNVKYVAEELEKAAPSFRNVPILLDHKNEVRSIVGRTTENVKFERGIDGVGRIPFEGKIMDKQIREMISDGRIQNVSIGAKVSDLVEEEDGSMKAIGMQGLEISLVACPGDMQATLGQAMQDSFTLKETLQIENELNNQSMNELKEEIMKELKQELTSDIKLNKKEETTMTENVIETKQTEVTTEKVEAKEDAVITEMRKEIAEMKQLLIEKKKIKEELDKMSEKKDETKGEIKAEVKEQTKEVSSDVIVERNDTGKLALYKDYSKSSNLKRLVR